MVACTKRSPDDWRRTTNVACRLLALAAPAEQLEEEREDVKHVEEDAGGDIDRVINAGSPHAVERKTRVAAEDRQPQNGVDDIARRHRHKQGDQAEHDECQQEEEQDSVAGGQVGLDRVAKSSE